MTFVFLNLFLIISMAMPAPQLQELAIRNRLEWFVGNYLGHYLKQKSAEFHHNLYDALADRSVMYLAIEAGRSSAKSFCGSIAYPLWELCEGPYDEIQTFSQSGGATGMSTKWLKRIKRELTENGMLIDDYGLKLLSSQQDHIEVMRPNGQRVDLYCRGKGAAARGGRGVIVIDDPQKVQDVKSETVLESDKDWLLEDVLPIALEGQRVIFIGTPISPISLLSTVKKLPGFKVLSFPAEHPKHSGRSAWPEQWSDDFLAMRKAQMGLDRYASEYLCEPRVPGTPVFKSEWFKFYEADSVQFGRISKDFVFTVTGFDGAESKASQADYTAIVTISATEGVKPDYYVREVKRERWSVKEGAEQLLLTFDQYKQNQTVVESRCAPPNKDAIIEELEERQRIYHKYVNLQQVKPTRDKVTRASGVQSLVQEGRVYFNPSDKNQSHLMDELTMFTGSQDFHDDCVDALVYALRSMRTREESGNVQVVSTLAENW